MLRNAYLFDGTHVGADAVVEESIVGAGVEVGAGSVVRPGCLVGDGVVLGRGARLGRCERVSVRRVESRDGEEGGDEESDEEWEEVEAREYLGDGMLSGCRVLTQSYRTFRPGFGDCYPRRGLERYRLAKRPLRVRRRGRGGCRVIQQPAAHADRCAPYFGLILSCSPHACPHAGDTASDLDLSDAGSVTSDSDSDSESDASTSLALSRTSSATSLSHAPGAASLHTLHASAAASEFRAEVAASLERAFAEGHALDDAAVELKTLRMASNVPLRRVREAVVAAIVERVRVAEGGAGAQRAEIARVVARWGPLIDRIGGVDAVETVEVLQVRVCPMPSCIVLAVCPRSQHR